MKRYVPYYISLKSSYNDKYFTQKL